MNSNSWKSSIKTIVEIFGEEYLRRFTPVSKSEMETFEKMINRNIPADFKVFYQEVGFGSFLRGGNNFYSPIDIDQSIGATIYFIRGSLFPGSEWATKEEHRQLWLSHGRVNPNTARFSEEALTLEGIKLYDLLQFGIDGNGGYHQLYVGPDPAPFSYCLLTDSGTINNRAGSFSEALHKIILETISESQ